MNTRITLLTLWLAVVGCGFSCATGDLEQTAYRTVGAVAVTVDTSMNAFGDYVRAGKATPEQQAMVKAAYERYQLAMRAAHNSITAYKSAPDDGTPLDMALRAVESIGGELISLIRQLTTPASP